MKRNSALSITDDNASPDYDAAKDIAELELRNARAERRAKAIKQSLVFGAIVAGAVVASNYWQQIAQFFR